MWNAKRLKLRRPDPDPDERAFRDELRKGCSGFGNRRVIGRWDGRWRYRSHCEPGCPSWIGQQGDFTGHTIAHEAAQRAGLRYFAADGTSGGVVVAAGPGAA